MKNKKFACPTCGSVITEMKYYQIVGVVEARVKAEKEIKLRLKEAEGQKKVLVEKQKAMLRQNERDKKIAIKVGIEAGKKKEKSRADRMANQANAYLEQVKAQNSKIRELQLQLKKGTTAQDEGRDFELELVKQLKKEFPSDTIEHHGQAGDILHKIIFKTKEIGSILYECKKTATFNNDYIHQTKRAKASRNATYGVLVTFVSKKNTKGFYVENDVIVVHPYGTIYIAQVLRNSVIEMNALKLNHKELEGRAQDLMDFIKGDGFKNSVENTIYRTRELADSLQKEVKAHHRLWHDRIVHYNEIHNNANKINIATSNILKGIPLSKGLAKGEMKQLPQPNIN
jgi:hypothetical protein